jgi:hypothetical protein
MGYDIYDIWDTLDHSDPEAFAQAFKNSTASRKWLLLYWMLKDDGDTWSGVAEFFDSVYGLNLNHFFVMAQERHGKQVLIGQLPDHVTLILKKPKDEYET